MSPFPLLLAGILALPISALALDSATYSLQLQEGSNYRLRLEPTNKSTTKASPTLSAKPYAEEIAAAADEAGVDPALVHAVIAVESGYRADSVSPKGALGLMQVMPETARRFGVTDAAQPKANLRAGTRYLRTLLDRFDQRTDLALAAYNAGEGAVLRHSGSIPPYPETQLYVPAVLKRFTEWRNAAPNKINYYAGTRQQESVPSIPSSQKNTRKL